MGEEVEGEEREEEEAEKAWWSAEVVRGDMADMAPPEFTTREVLGRRPWGERTYKGEARPVGELVPFVVPEADPESDPTDSARLLLALMRPGL